MDVSDVTAGSRSEVDHLDGDLVCFAAVAFFTTAARLRAAIVDRPGHRAISSRARRIGAAAKIGAMIGH